MLDRLKALGGRPVLVALLIGLAVQILFTVHIDRPGRLMFDETHYIPAAKALFDLEFPRNIEHPMFGKELLAAGIWLFGDNVWGWRLVPSLFGSLTVVGAFAFLWLLLHRTRAAAIGALLAMLNQSLFVQARTGMLDVFLGALVVWAMVAFLWAMRGGPRRAWVGWIGGSLLLGFAVAVKWAAIPYVALAGLAFIVLRLRDHWPAKGKQLDVRALLSGRGQKRWAGLPALPALLAMGAVSLAAYFVTFLPAFHYRFGAVTLAGLIPLQFEMYAMQTQVLPGHTYESDWYSWPFMQRPIWYFYEEDMGAWRGVLLIGNPLLMWTGLGAVIACLLGWFRVRSMPALAVALLWIASLAIYIVIPKSLGFYYYYHLSGIFICMAIAVALDLYGWRNKGWDEWYLAAAAVVFAWFYPILSAAPLANGAAFNHWMLFPSWR